ncbi:MAG: PRD domain-containing protein [Micropruina sp.]|uniref:PRD domain-containing protein n=1 Tax=Micropruina sp. TaxID=2737536 RepID=UPI0039E4B7B3
MRIKKVLNSSVVLVSDADDAELILLGKGIGYGRKPGAEVPEDAQDQVFLALRHPVAKDLLELLNSIPPEFLELAREIIDHAERELHTTLHPHLYVALTDHLHFAVERARSGLTVVNRLAWEIQSYYPEEYRIGSFGRELLRERLVVELPEEEAANLAFHIANARHVDELTAFNAFEAAKLIDQVVTIVTYGMGVSVSPDNVHFSRFVTHMRYFADRFFADRMLTSADDFLFHELRKRYPQAMACAERVRSHVAGVQQRALPNEEVAYLALHIQRVSERR